MTVAFFRLQPQRSIPKDKMSEAMAAINAVTAAAPVHIGDVLLPDLLGTGVDVIATRDMERV